MYTFMYIIMYIIMYIFMHYVTAPAHFFSKDRRCVTKGCIQMEIRDKRGREVAKCRRDTRNHQVWQSWSSAILPSLCFVENSSLFAQMVCYDWSKIYRFVRSQVLEVVGGRRGIENRAMLAQSLFETSCRYSSPQGPCVVLASRDQG